MANLIQIKRSTVTATPGTLANGEMAYTANGDVLFVGSNGTVVPIGGKRDPGILTANQALVTNATGYMDEVRVANAVITALYANGSQGTNRQTLLSNGTAVYWGTGIAGSNTQIQFNDSNVTNATAAFTFDKATNTLFLSNAVTVGSNVILDTGRISIGNATINVVANSTQISVETTTVNSSVISIAGEFRGQTANLSSTVKVGSNVEINTSVLFMGNSSVNTTVNSSVISTGTFNGTFNVSPNVVVTLSGDVTGSGNTTLANLANGTISIATTIQPDSVALGVDTTGDYVANITAGVGISGSVSGENSTPTIAVVANNGIIANSTGVWVNPGTGVSVNATGVHIGQPVGTTDNVTFNDVTINGNTLLGSSTADVVSFNARVNTDIIPSANITYSLGTNALRFYEIHAQNTHSEYLYIDKDVTVSGNLVVSGSVFTVNVSTLSVTDSLIQLAANNTTGDSLDIGFYGSYQTGGGDHEHAGLFRDASSDTFKLFKGLTAAPTTTVDTSNNTYTQATLEAYLISSALTTDATSVAITANSTVNVNFTANSLTLSSALVGTSGGTGLNSYTSEDILVANSSNGFRKLGLGSDGYVLQSNGTAVVYGTLDGGTF